MRTLLGSERGGCQYGHPVFEQALCSTYTQDWPPHHALADAQALMAGYCVFRDKFGGINAAFP